MSYHGEYQGITSETMKRGPDGEVIAMDGVEWTKEQARLKHTKQYTSDWHEPVEGPTPVKKTKLSSKKSDKQNEELEKAIDKDLKSRNLK